MLDDFKKVSNDFQKGYREGLSGKYNAVVVVILIVVVLYFFQKWTGIPVLDWLENVGSWIIDKLLSLICELIK